MDHDFTTSIPGGTRRHSGPGVSAGVGGGAFGAAGFGGASGVVRTADGGWAVIPAGPGGFGASGVRLVAGASGEVGRAAACAGSGDSGVRSAAEASGEAAREAARAVPGEAAVPTAAGFAGETPGATAGKTMGETAGGAGGAGLGDSPATSPPAPTIRISSPGSVVASIPLLFGFHPENSLVVLGLGRAPGGRDHTIRHGVRIDLAQVRGNERVAAVELMQRLRDHNATEAVLVAYGPREATGPRARPDHCRKLMSAFVAQLGAGPREDRVTVVEAVFTTGSRWWSYMCRNARCCPATGTVVPAGPPQMLADAYAALGQTVFPTRTAMDATLDAYPMAVLRRTAKALTPVPPLNSAHWSTNEGIAAARALADDLLERQTLTPPAAADADAPPSKACDPRIADDEVAHLLAALGEWRVRDYLAGAAATRENAARLLSLATELARRAPRADLRLAPYTLAAWAAWALGRPSLAQCAVDRALAIDPECNFATLIRAGLHHAIDSPRVRMSAENTLLGLIGGDAEAEAEADTAAEPAAAEGPHHPQSEPSATGSRSGVSSGAPTSGLPRQHRQTESDASPTPLPPQRAPKNRRLAKS